MSPAVAAMRRINWISVTVGPGDSAAVLHGIGHRIPRATRVSLATAAFLARRGVPLVVRDQRGGR